MAALPGIDWTMRFQPARHFSWRVRASGWQWALGNDPAFSGCCDLVLATSLTGILPLKAHCLALRDTPLWLYFHENQFAHPLADASDRTSQAGWRFQSVQNALCADWLSFNTAFNRDTFFAGVGQMIKTFPESLPLPLEQWRGRSDVLPVPLDDRLADLCEHAKTPGLIVWNHRWEWDKAPDRFLTALVRLSREGVPFQLAMLGSGGGRSGALDNFADDLNPHIVAWGEADPASYRQWLAKADLGVSTALHDFQGLSMLELARAGARVVVPRRLAYPECLPDAIFYDGSETDFECDVSNLQNTLRPCLTPPHHTTAGRVAMPVPTWETWAGAYRKRMVSITSAATSDVSHACAAGLSTLLSPREPKQSSW